MPTPHEDDSSPDLVGAPPNPDNPIDGDTPAETDEFLADIGANDWAAFRRWSSRQRPAFKSWLARQWPRCRSASFVAPLLALPIAAGMLLRARDVGSVAGWLAGGLALGAVGWHAAATTSRAPWFSRIVFFTAGVVFTGGVWTLVSLGLEGTEPRDVVTDAGPLAVAGACAAVGLGAIAFVCAVHRVGHAGSWETPMCCVYVLMFLRSVLTLDALERSEGVGRFEILEAHVNHADDLPGLWAQWRSVQAQMSIAFVCGWIAFVVLALTLLRERRATRESPHVIVALPLFVLITLVSLRDLVSALTLSSPELATLDALMSASPPEAVGSAETALELTMAPLFGLAFCAAGVALVLVGTARGHATRAAAVAAIVTMSCSLLWGATEDRLSERFGMVRDSSTLDRGRPPNVVYQTPSAHDGVPRAVGLFKRVPSPPSVRRPSDDNVDCGMDGSDRGVDLRTEFAGADGTVYGRDVEAPERRPHSSRWTSAYDSYPPHLRPHAWDEDHLNKYPWLMLIHLDSWLIMTGSRPELVLGWLAMLLGVIIGRVIRSRRRSSAAAADEGPYRTASPAETTTVVADRADWARVVAVAGAMAAVALSFALGAAL